MTMSKASAIWSQKVQEIFETWELGNLETSLRYTIHAAELRYHQKKTHTGLLSMFYCARIRQNILIFKYNVKFLKGKV